MAWNEPGNKGNGDGKDPWGGGRRGNAQGPPDIDEIIKNIVNKFNSLFGSGGGGSRGGSGGVSKGATGGLLTLLLVAGVLLWAALGIYTVDASERGIVFRFGKVREAIVQPGLRWNPPLVDVVEIVNTQRVNSRSYQNEMLTSDENIINVDITIQYVIQDAKLFVVQVRDPESTLDHAAESALRHVVGSTEMDIVLTLGREELAVDVQDRLQSYIDLYQTGIQIVQVNVREVQAPDAVQPAFDDLIKALQDAETSQNQALIYANRIVPEARGEAQSIMEQANAYREEVIARAQGEASRFDQVLVEYKLAPEVTRTRLYIEAMESVMTNSTTVMIDVEGGNNMLYLPLDKLMEQSSVSGAGGLTNRELRSIVDQVIREMPSGGIDRSRIQSTAGRGR